MTSQQLTAGHGSVAIQVAGDNVVIAVGTASLMLERRHLRRAAPVSERDLLLTELRVTDLVGRGADLAALRAWLEEPRALPAVRCLTGRGGTGKTRLAIELCERAEASGWTAGFATHAELQRFHDARSLDDWRWGKPTLIVVDYAAASTRILRAWLEALARRRPVPGEPPLRLLLLERHADWNLGWWADLIRAGGLSGRGPEELAAPAEAIALSPLVSAADRRALLLQVVGLAAGFAGKAVPDLPPLGQDAAFDQRLGESMLETEPLFLMMAGIVGVTTGVPQALALGRTDLAMRIALSERDRLKTLSVRWGIDSDGGTKMLAHLVACITLQGGCDRAATIALIRQEREAMEWQLSRPLDWIAARLAEALHRPSGGADAIRPDIIGEAFLLLQLAEDDRPVEEQAAIVGRAGGRDAVGVVGGVIRTVQDYAGDRADHAAFGWLDHLIATANDLPALMRIADGMPEQTLALRERAAKVQDAVVRLLHDLAGESSDMANKHAQALSNLSGRLSDLGRWQDAAATAVEALSLRRALVAQRPNAFEQDLAMSLHNVAYLLGSVGRLEDALAAATEALLHYRALAAQQPETFQSKLAASLNSFANRLSALGRRKDALAAAEEAVLHHRALVALWPNAFRPQLAGSVNNLATMLSALGRREDALAAAAEALLLYRIITAQRPDAFRPGLAMSLINLASRRSEVGQWEDALTAAEEAVLLYGALAEQRPDAFRPNLASSLSNSANILSALGRPEDALAAAKEAASLRRALTASHPDAFRPDLATSISNLAIKLSVLGHREDALEAAEEAVSLRRALAVQRPDAFDPDLAMSLMVYAQCLDGMKRSSNGLRANTEAIEKLSAYFIGQPLAFDRLVGALVGDYRQRCAKLGQEPDTVLLGPIEAVFQQLRENQG